MMTEAMIWIGALLLVVGVIFMLVHEQRRRATMTEEEYEEQARGQVSLLGSTGLALDQILRPQSKTAIEYQQDQKRGQVPGGDHKGATLPDDERELSEE